MGAYSYRWQTKEYSNFPAWKIAALILTASGQTIRDGGQISDVINEMIARHLTRKVLPGLPKALYEKIRCRIRNVDVNVDRHYETPLNLDTALRSATELIADYS